MYYCIPVLCISSRFTEDQTLAAMAFVCIKHLYPLFLSALLHFLLFDDALYHGPGLIYNAIHTLHCGLCNISRCLFSQDKLGGENNLFTEHVYYQIWTSTAGIYEKHKPGMEFQ